MTFKKRYLWLFPSLLLAGLFAGPRPGYPAFNGKLPRLKLKPAELDEYLRKREAAVQKLKPGNESRIIWADSVRKTPYSVVYLHGWSACSHEGDPIHREFAERYGCNLYLPRLAGHGLDDRESFADLTPGDLVESAKEALAIGQVLGEKVILMSCSTGGTLSIYLAAENPEAVHAQLLFSPNIDIYAGASELLTMPWGKHLAEAINGKYFSFTPKEEAYAYWTTTYRTQGLVSLKSLVETTMTKKTWSKVKQPLFMGYYYKNEEEQDKTVSVEEMHRFFASVSTPAEQKRAVAFPDAGHHVVISGINSNDLASVRRESYRFAEEVLRLKPMPKAKPDNTRLESK